MSSSRRIKLSLIEEPRRAETAREFLASTLLRLVRRLTGNSYAKIVPNAVSADPELAAAISKAREVQKLGYDIGFSFLPRQPDAPHIYLCNSRFQTTQYGNGFDHRSRGRALKKALYEIVERFLWDNDESFWAKSARRGSSTSIRACAVDPLSVSGFSNVQRSELAHLGPLNHDTTFLWSRGISLSDGKATYVPTQLVSGYYTSRAREQEPLLRVPNSNGLASFSTHEGAAYRGLLELIERDAFMIAFHNTISAPRIEHASIQDPSTKVMLEEFRIFGLTVDLIVLPTDVPTSVICCCIRDESGEGPALAVGAKAHHDPEQAVRGAFLEAHAVWTIARDMKVYTMELPPEPWRIFERIAYWAKPENVKKLSWLWSGKKISLPSDANNAKNAHALAQALQKKDIEAICFTMTPPALEALGFNCVIVVSPQLQPIYLESEPKYLGGERLRSVPLLLGYEAKDSPPPYPHPFP